MTHLQQYSYITSHYYDSNLDGFYNQAVDIETKRDVADC